MKTIKCYQCKQPIIRDKNSFGTGYGIDKKNHKICYKCCGINDSEELKKLKPKEKMCLYLTGVYNQRGNISSENCFITNWPASLKIKVYYIKSGNHNIAGIRYDVYFKHEGFNYHGVTYGNNTEICHIQKVK